MIAYFRDITLGSILRTIGIGVLVISIIFYIQFQARNIIEGPIIYLNTTADPVQHGRMMDIEGTAKNIVKLTLNGKEIHTNESGVFKQTIMLEKGYTIIELRAEDRFGRDTTVEREYVYTPAT